MYLKPFSGVLYWTWSRITAGDYMFRHSLRDRRRFPADGPCARQALGKECDTLQNWPPSSRTLGSACGVPLRVLFDDVQNARRFTQSVEAGKLIFRSVPGLGNALLQQNQILNVGVSL